MTSHGSIRRFISGSPETGGDVQVASVGSGPAGYYGAQQLRKRCPAAAVTVVDPKHRA